MAKIYCWHRVYQEQQKGEFACMRCHRHSDSNLVLWKKRIRGRNYNPSKEEFLLVKKLSGRLTPKDAR